MPLFVHIAPEPEARKIVRNGIRAQKLKGWIDGCDRFVWAFPVLESYTLTHQWMRELKRSGQTTLSAITFKTPDGERVFARHFSNAPVAMTAAEAVAVIRSVPDARGYEIVIPRRIQPAEIKGVRILPRAIGWRYYPDAKNKPLKTCDCPCCMPKGEVNAARYRARVLEEMKRKGVSSVNFVDDSDDTPFDDDDE